MERRVVPPVVPKLCLGMRPREALLRNLNPRRNLGIILKRKLPRRSEITSPTVTLHPRESRGMENRKQINCHPLSFPSGAWERQNCRPLSSFRNFHPARARG